MTLITVILGWLSLTSVNTTVHAQTIDIPIKQTVTVSNNEQVNSFYALYELTATENEANIIWPTDNNKQEFLLHGNSDSAVVFGETGLQFTQAGEYYFLYKPVSFSKRPNLPTNSYLFDVKVSLINGGYQVTLVTVRNLTSGKKVTELNYHYQFATLVPDRNEDPTPDEDSNSQPPKDPNKDENNNNGNNNQSSSSSNNQNSTTVNTGNTTNDSKKQGFWGFLPQLGDDRISALTIVGVLVCLLAVASLLYKNKKHN